MYCNVLTINFQLRAKAFSSMKENNFRRGKVEVYTSQDKFYLDKF